MILPEKLTSAQRAIGWALTLGGLFCLLSVLGCACPGPIIHDHLTNDRWRGVWPVSCQVTECRGRDLAWCRRVHGLDSTLCEGKR